METLSLQRITPFEPGDPDSEDLDAPDIQEIRSILVNRKRKFQAYRNQSLTNSSYLPYSPPIYPHIPSRAVKRRLTHIARRFQFLDCYFAEYFRLGTISMGYAMTREQLADAKESLRKAQASLVQQDQRLDPEHDSVYIGDLGVYCEIIEAHRPQDRSISATSIFRRWLYNLKFDELVESQEQNALSYLQDALEVPYWELIIKLFLNSRSAFSMIPESVLRVLDSVKIDIEIELCQLTESEEFTAEIRDVSEPIIAGITQRLDLLRNVLDENLHNSDYKEDLLASLWKQPAKVKDPPAQPKENGVKNIENVIIISLLPVFFLFALTPFCKGFNISMTEGKTGSTGDADFWYLAQNSLMTVLGSLSMIVPLWRRSTMSAPYIMMWFFFALGFVAATVCVSIYPFVNPGWSSLVSFFLAILPLRRQLLF